MNIPIYRARVLGLDNNYIIGFYQQYIEGFEDNVYHEINNTLIDPTTLAIHFPDMLDSQGNKIFASLGNIGGSVLTDREYEFNLYFDGRKYRVIGNEINSEINDYEEWKDFKVIGIQE